mgnify:CR=1 FL=1
MKRSNKAKGCLKLLACFLFIAVQFGCEGTISSPVDGGQNSFDAGDAGDGNAGDAGDDGSECLAQCENKECGDDGCGGVCGSCQDGMECNADQICESPLYTRYFVSKQGLDTNDGTSWEQAFLTIQRGVDALQAGDMLTIGPGEYFESVVCDDLGNASAQTVIQAQIPGTVVLRGDEPAPEFTKVEGYRFVYAAPFDREPRAVMDRNSQHTYFPKANVVELEFAPGYFHYDSDAGMLYLSNPDLGPASQGRYTISTTSDHGLELTSPQRVTIDGLAATGFDMGILMFTPESCVVRNCVLYMNVAGVMMQSPDGIGEEAGGSNNLVERNVAYGNTYAGIARYSADNDTIRHNYTYKNVREDSEHFGIIHYGHMFGPLLMLNNIAWGHNFNYSVKAGDQEEYLANSVGLGYIRISNEKVSHNLIAGGNEYDRTNDAPGDSVLFEREADLDQDFEFADADNLDFRLQPDSRFIGTAPDGSDRGPYPYEANIFYLSPTGDDHDNDGLSMRSPWQTLGRAFADLRPGDTVYLSAGWYDAAPLSGAGDGQTPIRILGRGRQPVVIAGLQTVTGGAGLVFERLAFSGGIALSGTSGARFNNCTFFDAAIGLDAASVADLQVTHSLFADASLRVSDGNGVLLSGNVYANNGIPALRLDAASKNLYSDYNGYRDSSTCWQVGASSWSLADLQQRHHDVYSLGETPDANREEAVPRMEGDPALSSAGPNSTGLGVYHEYDLAAKSLGVVGPILHSVSDTTANIEWWTSHPANYELIWNDERLWENDDGAWLSSNQNPPHDVMGNDGDYYRDFVTNDFFHKENGSWVFLGTLMGYERSRTSDRFISFSLRDLTPGQTYHFKIVSLDAREVDSTLAVLSPDDLSFTTETSTAAPRVFYVAPDGADANDGLSRGSAFQTISRAADQVRPGDTVLIAEGDYAETVRIRVAGTEAQPISFRAMTGERPRILLENLPRSFMLNGKPDIRIDGLFFEGGYGYEGGMEIADSPRVRITRCMNAMISASDCPDMLVKNNVLYGGGAAVGIGGSSPGSTIENNMVAGTILRDVSAGAGVTVRRNIFCDAVRNKMHQTLLQVSDEATEEDNCFYTLRPEVDKLAVNDQELAVYAAQTGSNSFFSNPMMPGGLGWFQGWSRVSMEDFDVCFSSNPELILRDIGLQPDAFSEYTFETSDWPYTPAWAAQFIAARETAEALEAAGQDADALDAYNDMLANLPMGERLESEILKAASLCAQRLEDYVQATQLAEAIPLEPLAMHRQMELMLARGDTAGLVAAFNQNALGGRAFHLSYVFPEHEDVMADLYYYRALAYADTGDLAAAEADLRVMNDKREQLTYTSGTSIHDLAWLRLGDFYRTELNDDDRALAEYLQVCDRTTWEPFGTVDKPVLTGASETLVLATEAACEILRARGEHAAADELEASLAQAQAEAAAALAN